jgi:tetratricopeptide (TPR) repeat protein
MGRRVPPWAWLSLAVVAVGSVIALRYYGAHHRLAARLERAELSLAQLTRTLDPGAFAGKQRQMGDLLATMDDPRAVRTWIRYLCWGSLVRGEAQSELRPTLARHSGSGIEPATLALAAMVEQLNGEQKDSLRSAVARFDKVAAEDDLYQTAAGLALERDGQVAAALGHYKKALQLDPQLAIAKVANVRLLMLKGDLAAARTALTSLGRSGGNEAAVRVLESMLWLSDPANTGPAPSTSVLTDEQASRLPAPLVDFARWLPLRIDQKADAREAACASAAATLEGKHPGLTLAWFAEQGLRARCISAAQTSAEAALPLLPDDPRIAETVVLARLAEGRLDKVQTLVDSTPRLAGYKDTLKAVRDFEGGNVVASLKAGLTAKDTPLLAAVRAFPSVLEEGGPKSEQEIARLDDTRVAWGELVAVDSALNHGNLDLGARLVSEWPSSYQSPAHLLRLARLARYQNKPAVAANLAEAAAYENTNRQAIVERVLALLANRDTVGGVTVTVRFAEQLGSLKPWLDALLAAKASPGAAQRLIAGLELPGEAYPIGQRVVAARALAATRDPRAEAYVQELAALDRDHPDLVATQLVK